MKLIFEPGKYIISEAGVFLCRVNSIKQTTSTVFAQVDSGFNHLIRPMMYGANHSIENNSNQLLNYTNIIKKNPIDIKKDIIEHLWKVIISDNSIDQYESNLMRRICGLIYFSDKECAEIKLKLLNSK